VSKRTKVWLVISIVLTVYLIYMVGVAAITTGLQDRFILDFLSHPNNLNGTLSVINWVGLLSIVMWVVWGVSFVKDQ